MIIKNYEITSGVCPTQIEGELESGEVFYLRYRNCNYYAEVNDKEIHRETLQVDRYEDEDYMTTKEMFKRFKDAYAISLKGVGITQNKEEEVIEVNYREDVIEIEREAERLYKLDTMWQLMKDDIRRTFKEQGKNYESDVFHNVIWDFSTRGLGEKEVSIIVDANDKLFISKGTRSFVDYEDEDVSGMKIPMKCWIHTHPFGQAYFSSTDWFTINNQKPILNSAIVLGDNQKMKWTHLPDGKEQLCRIQTIPVNDSEE